MASPQVSTHIHQLLDEHWTTTLNVEPSVWRDADVVIASHPEPSHRDHVYLIRREDSCIIVVPQTLVGSTTIACASWPSAAVFDRAFVRTLYGEEVSAIHGPFWLGYATTESFRRVDTRDIRRLDGPADRAALAALRSQVPEDQAIDAGFDVGARREYGCFVDGQLVCAGTLTPFRGLPANIGALTHPAHRNQGFGTAMVSALTVDALAESRTAQFRVLEDNRAALRIARVLGYVEDGHTFEVVLRPAERSRATG
jgi:RimJ/RimL family protein N-acetyltransferase